MFLLTCVKVVLCLRLAGVGQEAVVGVWPACCGPSGDKAEVPLEVPELPVPPGSGFNFLNAPSAVGQNKIGEILIADLHLQHKLSISIWIIADLSVFERRKDWNKLRSTRLTLFLCIGSIAYCLKMVCHYIKIC